MDSKPFRQDEARRIVQSLQKPAVFLNMTTNWPALHWTVEHLSSCLTDRIRFRIGKKTQNRVSFPYQSVTSCSSNAGKVDRSAWSSAFSGSDSAHIDKVVKTILTPVSIALEDNIPNMLRSVTFLADDRGIQANHNVLVSWPIGGHCAFQNDELCTKSEHFRKTGINGATIMYAPLFETDCTYIEANIKEFLDWTAKDGESVVGPFSGYHSKEFWAYADYKYIAQLFQDKPAMFQDVVWSDFGFPGRDGRDSTIWIGTQGANTPCHLDSYGCNLVFQIQGRKRWHLFPPDDTPCLYPTRIPYEESSVFSRVSVVQAELKKFPAFKRARVHTVTLQPGQVLFVPRHWWHYVESLDQVTISVNSWIEMDIDDEARVEEALTKTIVCAMKSVPSLDNEDHWLNPTEEGVSSHDENMHYLNLAVKAYMNKRRDHTEDQCLLPEQHTAGKRDSSGLLKTPMPDLSFVVPFGPHLIPVNCAEKPCPKDTSVSQSTQPRLKCEGELGGDGELNQSSGLHGQETENSRTSNGPENGVRISTNDMLECLVHPDVIALITRLIVCRQTELNS